MNGLPGRPKLIDAEARADRGESSSRWRAPALSGLSALRSGSLLPSSFASRDLRRQRIELRLPELSEPLQPRIDALQRVRIHGLDASCAVNADRREAVFT